MELQDLLQVDILLVEVEQEEFKLLALRVLVAPAAEGVAVQFQSFREHKELPILVGVVVVVLVHILLQMLDILEHPVVPES
jgi:hypothetical protein